MTLAGELRDRLVLPAMVAPMTLVSGPELVIAACRAGLLAGLPTGNARAPGELECWLRQINEALTQDGAGAEEACATLVVNLTSVKTRQETIADIDLCRRYGVATFVTAMGDPREVAQMVHDRGGRVLHDVTTIRHAEKAVAAGVDGVVAIGAGGGGHAGIVNHLVLVPRIRSMFDGTIVMAGGVSTGAAIRAAEVLGADLAYLGTRFIATRESRAPEDYKQMLVAETADQLLYTAAVSGLPASWLTASLRANGLDPDDLPVAAGRRTYDHLPPGVRPWKTIFSAGQGVELVHDVPTTDELVRRLRAEYVEACAVGDMAEVAELEGPA